MLVSDIGRFYMAIDHKLRLKDCRADNVYRFIERISFKVVSREFYFHKPIIVHIELYLFYRFIHFLLYIGQY